MTGIPSTSLQVVREILVCGDAATRQTQPERLAGEHVDLPSVPLDSMRMKVLTHDGDRGLELGLEPRRGVRKPLLGRGEAIVGGAERLGEALCDPSVRLPLFAPDDDQMLRRKRAGVAEVLLLDRAEIREEADHRARAGMIGLRTRRAVDGLQL